MARFDPLICDLDGTLVDSREAITAAIREAFAELQRPIPDEHQLALCVGPPLRQGLLRIVGEDGPVDELVAVYRRHYAASARRTRGMPHAVESLSALAARGIALAVATYKPLPLAQTVLRAASLSEFFPIVVAPSLDEEPTSKTDLIREAISRIGRDPSRTVYVGDHRDDTLAAETLGIAFLKYPDKVWEEIAATVLGSELGPPVS